MTITLHHDNPPMLEDGTGQAVQLDAFLQAQLRVRLLINEQTAAPTDMGDGCIVYADGTTYDPTEVELPGLVVQIGEVVHKIAHGAAVDNIPDVTGAAADTDAESRATIALILDALLAYGLMKPPAE